MHSPTVLKCVPYSIEDYWCYDPHMSVNKRSNPFKNSTPLCNNGKSFREVGIVAYLFVQWE